MTRCPFDSVASAVDKNQPRFQRVGRGGGAQTGNRYFGDGRGCTTTSCVRVSAMRTQCESVLLLVEVFKL